MKNIFSEYLSLGKNTFVHPSAVIKGINGNAQRIVIGDNVYIGERVQVLCDDFELGDYSKIQHDTNIHGYKPCKIGHNAWIGQFTIIDCIGGVTIGNNCGIGAHSQLWSHIKYGDTLEGSRFCSEKPLVIGNDVWFVGHCIVSPAKIEDKAMALAGSVVIDDMKYNTIYAGTPAKSISDRMGFQFSEVTIAEKMAKMNEYLNEWGGDTTLLKLVENDGDVNDEDEITYFNVATRRYTKKMTEEEISFMKFLLPSKAKFIPYT